MDVQPNKPVRFPKVLKELRKKKGIGQDVLAALLNKSRTTISNYENGYSHPLFDDLIKIADYFKVNLDYLVFGLWDNPSSDDPSIITKDDIQQLRTNMAELEEKISEYQYLINNLRRELVVTRESQMDKQRIIDLLQEKLKETGYTDQ